MKKDKARLTKDAYLAPAMELQEVWRKSSALEKFRWLEEARLFVEKLETSKKFQKVRYHSKKDR